METVERIWIHIKSMRGLFFLPLAVYYLLIPFAAYVLQKSPLYEVAGMAGALKDYVYPYVPAVSVFWLVLCFAEYIQGQGGELLWNPSAMTGLAAGIYLLQLVCLLPAFVLAGQNDRIMDLLLQMLVIIFFMHGLAYFLCMVTRNTAASVFVVLVYSVLSMAHIGTHSQWFQYRTLDRTDWIFYGCGYLLAGILLFAAAHMIAKKRPAR